MVAWSDVLRWDRGALDGVGDALTAERKTLDDVLAYIEDGSAPHEWSSEAAEAAQRSLRERIDEVEGLKADVASMVTEVDGASEAVAALQRAIGDAQGLAENHGFLISDAGTVHDQRPDLGDTPEDVLRRREAVQVEVTDRIGEILRRAADIDDDLVTAMARLSAGEVGGGATVPGSYIDALNEEMWGDVPPPPLTGSPTEVAGWWATLTDDEREWLVANQPDRLGSMDGLPTSVRSEANMLRLPAERERLETQLDELRTGDRDGDIDAVQAKLDSLDSVETMMEDENRSLITLDLDGERARAAIGTGNVDTAEKVSVFTPGMDATVGETMPRYVQEMEQVQAEAQRMLEDRLLTADQEVASVVYLDYEPPKTEWPEILEGAQPDRSEEGAQRLEPFLDGLEANRNGENPMHLTASGHSFGSPTTGLAVRGSSAADAVVFHGSPGVGSTTIDPTAGEGHLDDDQSEDVLTDSTQMRVPEGSMYNLSNEGDWVANIGWHGVNPTLDEHITELSTEDATAADGRQLRGTEGHSSYVELREPTDERLSTSEYNTAAVIADRTDLLIEQP